MESPPEVNPYQAPAAVANEPAIASADDTASARSYMAWSIVFAGNLAIPLILGLFVTENGGRWGMLAAVALLFTLGCWLCSAARRWSKALVVGGVAVGLTQAIPVLQVMAGTAGLGLTESLGLGRTVDPDGAPVPIASELSGFAATLVTGGLLMTAALVVGLAIRGLSSKWARRP